MLRPASPEQRAIYTALIDAGEVQELGRLRLMAGLVADETQDRLAALLEMFGLLERRPVDLPDD